MYICFETKLLSLNDNYFTNQYNVIIQDTSYNCTNTQFFFNFN